MKKELIIATTNVHKLRELREMLKPFQQFDILSLINFPDYVPPEETGSTFEENALLKAEHAAKALNKLVLADDAGLVVPILNGAPGLLSRRYAGEDATDAENRQKLLQALSGKNDLERAAYCICCLAISDGKTFQKHFTGRCEGKIAKEERGRHGFGYDPIFIKHDYDKTFGEIDDQVKNRISHRRKAFEKASLVLETL